MEGDASKHGSYDALRFCNPSSGDSRSQWGGRDRKCCGITEAVPTISEGEFVQSFVCKHEVLALNHHDGSDTDGADFFDIDDEASEHHDTSGPPDDHDLFECRDLTLDDEANFFYDSGDFSFATLLDLLEKYQTKLGKYGTKRASVINTDIGVYCPFGAFVLGGVKGVTRATTENTALVRYLNGFARAHVGQEATWSSVIVTKGVHSKVHHDLHNLSGSWNYCAAFGHHGSGGELWIATPDISDQEANDRTLIWKNAGPSGWLPGRAHPTEETFVKFDPAEKHAVLPGHEGGWHMVCYTARGATELDGNLTKFLKNCGFPMPRRDVGRKEAVSRRPRKAVRNSIGNMVGKLSVLFTTLLTAASSFLSEAVETHPIYDPIVMFEIGGLDGTMEATDLGKAVMEPMSWEEYSDPDYVEKAYHTVRGATPRELRLHLDRAPDCVQDDLKDLIWEQLEAGGVVVLQGGRPDDFVKDLDNYIIYQSAQDDEGWTVLAKPKRGEKFVPGDLIPHQVCVVENERDGAPPPHERPLRIDGSGIKFDQSVAPHVQAALRRLHRNLGHPRKEDLLRHLRLAGCENHILKAVRGMVCETCQSTSQPQAPRPSTLPRMQEFGETTGMDVLYAHDINDQRHTFLSMVDFGTTYHIVVPIESTSAAEIERAFNDFWVTPYGPPNTLALDLETGLQSGVARLCGWHAIRIRNAATQSHWQAGLVERQGQWWKSVWTRVVHHMSVESEEVKLAATMVNSAKNSLRRRCGHSPAAWVFGREARVPPDLKDPDGGERLSFDISTEAKFQREAAMRASARIAFHKSEGDAKLRRALMQRARATTRPFEHGEAVRYWNKPKDRRQGRWIGPAVVVGREGPNYWIAQGGRCRLTSPEHLRASGPEESGEFLSMAGVKREVELLLQEDLDDEEVYQSEPDGEEDDHMSDYAPSQGDPALKTEDAGHDEEGDAIFLDQDEAEHPVELDDHHDRRDEHPRRRMKRKTPPDTVEWDANLAANTSEVMMMMRRKLTRRGLEKPQEKELKWTEIPGEYRQKFRDAEEKQWREHLHFDALEPLDDAQTAWVRANIGAERVLGARWAYKDKNWSRRRQGEQVEWKCKSRLVIAGHRDPDLEKGQLSTDSPTISRPGLLCLLQVLANGLHAPDPWQVLAGDIQCAFLTGSYLDRDEELFISQPVTGFPGMKPGQLVRVKKNIFGLATSPREWWEDLQDGFRRVKINIGEENYQFDQCPLDPCIFTLRKADDSGFSGTPIGYVGTHVDDLLVVAPGTVSALIKHALSQEFPIDDWEAELFSYLGSEVHCCDDEVVMNQKSYVDTRLFKLEIPEGANDDELASEDLVADNRSLVGALSWLSAQTRPDLTCAVSMAQQLQKRPTVGDLKFSNSTAKKALDFKDEGLRFRPLDIEDMVVLVYHDAGWANAKDTEHDEPYFELTAEDKAAGLQVEGPFVNRDGRKAKRDNSKVASQLGDLVLFANKKCLAGGPSDFSVADWKSRAGQRVCRSTFSAETQACVEGLEAGQHVRALFETLLAGDLVRVEEAKIPLFCLSDCRSLFDHVHKQGLPRVPADRRLAVDLAALRQGLKGEQWSHKLPLGWVPSGHQLGDILTKPQDPSRWWAAIKQKLLVPLFVTESAPGCRRPGKVRKTSVSLCVASRMNGVFPYEYCVTGLPETPNAL